MNPYSEVREWFSYVALYAPDFPSEDEVEVEGAFKKLFDLIQKARGVTKNADKVRWIELCKQEAHDALALYRRGLPVEGERVLRSAKARFDNVTLGKKLVVDFIVGADGTAAATGQDEGGIKPE